MQPEDTLGSSSASTIQTITNGRLTFSSTMLLRYTFVALGLSTFATFLRVRPIFQMMQVTDRVEPPQKIVNDFVKKLVSAIDEAASLVHCTNVRGITTRCEVRQSHWNIERNPLCSETPHQDPDSLWGQADLDPSWQDENCLSPQG